MQLLETQSGLDSKGREELRAAMQLTQPMDFLVGDLLELATIRTRDPVCETVCVQSVLGTVLRSLATAVERSGTVVTHDTLPCVRASRRRLIQLFDNLIDNAIKFQASRQLEIHIGVSSESEGEFVFFVRDNGKGIGLHHQKDVFDLFQRYAPDDEIPGSGIGLAICQAIVEHYGGSIWLESEPNRGGTFYFTLPKPKNESTG